MVQLYHEEDFPPGHPARHDYNPDSKEAKEWRRINVHPKGERDWPVDHPAAADTPGNKNALEWKPGLDPSKPELEAFTGRDPETAARHHAINRKLMQDARESIAPEPIEAPKPPAPGSAALPTGQPG